MGFGAAVPLQLDASASPSNGEKRTERKGKGGMKNVPHHTLHRRGTYPHRRGTYRSPSHTTLHYIGGALTGHNGGGAARVEVDAAGRYRCVYVYG